MVRNIFICIFFILIGSHFSELYAVDNDKITIKCDASIKIEGNDKYLYAHIYLKDPTGYLGEGGAFTTIALMLNFDEKIFLKQTTAEGNQDFSFIPTYSGWNDERFFPKGNVLKGIIRTNTGGAVAEVMYGNGDNRAIKRDVNFLLSKGQEYDFGVIKWKLLPTASGLVTIEFREEVKFDKQLTCGGLDLDGYPIDFLFENAIINIVVPDDPLASVDKPIIPDNGTPKEWATYICNPEKTVTYTVTRPSTVDSCSWYLSMDAAGQVLAPAGVATIALSNNGEQAQVTWKNATTKTNYYLQVFSKKGTKKSDPVNKMITVEGFPEIVVTPTLDCKKTTIAWVSTAGITTVLYAPDYLTSVPTSPKEITSESTWHFVSYRTNMCKDTFDYDVKVLDPVLSWEQAPPAQVNRGVEILPILNNPTLPDSYTATSIKYMWTKPAGLGETVKVPRIESAMEAQYEFEVYADVDGCHSNTLKNTTIVTGGGILPNIYTESGKTVVCKDGGIKLFVEPSPVGNYTYKWYVEGQSDSPISTEKSVWVTPTADTKYVVEVIDAGGKAPGKEEITITYNGAATPYVVSAGEDLSILKGTSTILKGEITQPGSSSTYTWKWTPFEKLQETTIMHPQTTNLTADQVFSVYILDDNNCMSEPDNMTVKVMELLDPPSGGGETGEFAVSVSPAVSTLCKNNKVQFHINATGVNLEGATYAWLPTAGLDDPSSASPVLEAKDGVVSGDYIVTITKGDLKIVRKVKVTIKDELAPQIQFTDGERNCTGDVLVVEKIGTLVPDEYIWTINGVEEADRSMTSYTFATTGDYSIKIYAKQNAASCASDTLSLTKSIGQRVVAADVSGDVSTCASETQLSFTGVTPEGGAFAWMKPDKTTVVSNSDKQITADESGTWYLVCGEGACTDTTKIAVVVNNVLTVEGLKPVVSNCLGSVDLAFTSTTATTFVWLDKDKKQIPASKDQNPYTVTQEGMYYLALDGGNCFDTLSVKALLNTAPVVDVKEKQTVCALELAINGTASAGTLYWATDPQGENLVSGNTVTGVKDETKTFYVYATDGVCESAKKEVKVSFGTAPEVIAEPIQTACGRTCVLSGIATGGEIIWLASDKTPLPSTTVMGEKGTSAIYYAYAKDGDCEGSQVKITVQFGVSPKLTVKNLQTTCADELQLIASSTGGTIVWEDSKGKELLTTLVKKESESEKTAIYYVTAKGDGCESVREKVEVRFGATPEIAAEPLQTTCGDTYTLSAGTSAGTLLWWKDAAKKNPLPSLTVTKGSDVVSSYYVSAKDGSCESLVKEIRVAFGAAPEVTVVSPQTSCGDAIKLKASTTGGTLVWKKADGTPVTEDIKGEENSTQTYYVYAIDGSCKSVTEEVIVQFNASPKIYADARQTSCGGTHSLKASVSGGSISWFYDADCTNPIPSNFVSGENEVTYYATASDNGCLSGETISVTVAFGHVPELEVETPQASCELLVKLKAKTTGGDLIWLKDGKVLPTSQVTGVSGSSVTYQVYAKGDGCETPKKDVVVNFGKKPTIIVEPLQTTCGEEYNLQASTGTSTETIHWLAADKTTPVTGAVTGVAGTTTTFYAYAENAGCRSELEKVEVAFGEMPVVKVTPLTTCGTTIQLTASVSGGTAVWTDKGGTILTNTLRSGIIGATDVYYVYATDGKCSSAKERVEVSFGAKPQVIVNSDATACGEYTLTAVSTDPTTTLHWLQADQTTPQLDLKVSGSNGDVKDYYVYADNETCRSVNYKTTVHFGVKPILNVTTPQTACDTIVVLKATSSVNEFVWEDAAGKTLTSSQVHGPAGTNAVYYVHARDGECVSEKEAVKVSFGADPELDIEPLQASCGTEYKLQATASQGIICWEHPNGDPLLNTLVKGDKGTSATYYAYAQDGSCKSDKQLVMVHFGMTPEVKVVSPQTTCDKLISLNASATGGKVVWTDINGYELPLAQATGEIGDRKQFYVYAKGESCESVKELVDVKFGAKPEVITEPVQTTCGGTHTLAGIASDGLLYWFEGATELKSLNVTGNRGETKTYTVYAKNGEGCVGETKTVKVIFGKEPAINVLSPQTACGNTIKLQASASGGEIVWTDAHGTVLLTDQVTPPVGVSQAVYYVFAKDATCESAKIPVDVKFGTMPEVIAEARQTACGTEHSIVAIASQGTIHWLDTDGVKELPSAKVSGALNATKTYYVYAQGETPTCKSEKKQIAVTFGAKPEITVASPQVTCDNIIKLNATATGGSVFWETADGQPLLIAQLSKPVDNDVVNCYVYAATSREETTCKTAKKPVTVKFGAKPAVTVLPFQTSCGENYTLQATASEGATIQWLASDGTTEISPDVRGELKSDSTYYVYAKQGECQSDRVKVTVSFGVSPIVEVANAQTTCETNSLTLKASTSGGSLVWLEEDKVTELTNTTVSGMTGKSFTYYVYAKDGACESPMEKVTASFGVAPSVIAESLQTSCEGEHILTATATGGTLHWLGADKVELTTTTVKGLPGTTADYYVYAQDGTASKCKTAEQKITVAFGVSPEIKVVSPQTTCDDEIKLEATTSAGNLVWEDAVGTKLTTTQLTKDVNGSGDYYVYAQDGRCASVKEKVKVSFGTRPVVILNDVQTACGTEHQLVAQASDGELKWLQSNGVTALPSSIVKKEMGNTFYVYAQNGTSCRGDNQKITVLFETAPIVDVVSPQTTCGTLLKLKASTTDGNLVWLNENGDEMKVTQVSGLAGEEQTYYVYAKGNGCESAREQVKVRFSVPEVMVEEQQTACETTHTLKATASAGDLVWLQADNTTLLSSTTVTGTKGESTDYYVYAKEGDCESVRTKVTVHFGVSPVLNVENLQTTCENKINLKASATGGELFWTDAKGVELLTTQVSGTVGTNAFYYVTAKGEGCESTQERVEVRFGAKPEVFANALQTTCGTEYTLVGTASSGELCWLQANGVTPLTSTKVQKPASSNTSVYYVYAKSGKECIGDKKKITVAFNTNPVVNVISPQTVCDNGGQITLKAEYSGGELVWMDKNNTILKTPVVSKTEEGDTFYYVYAKGETAGCESIKERVDVQFGKGPVLYANAIQTTCGKKLTLAASASSGDIYWLKSDKTTPLVSTTVEGDKLTPGTYFVYAKDGSCETEKMEVTAQFETSPVLKVVSPQTTCGSTLKLAASTTGGELVWTKSDNTPVIPAILNDVTDGNGEYYVQAVDGTCASVKQPVTVKFGVKPEVIAQPLQTVCGEEYTLVGKASSGKLVWEENNVELTTTVVTGKNEVKTYYVYADAGNGCQSDKKQVKVAFGAAPVINVVNTQTTCGTTIQLKASATGGNIVWTDASGVKLTQTQRTYTTEKTEVYYVYAEDGECIGLKERVDVIYNETPTLLVEKEQTTCGTEHQLIATATGGEVYWINAKMQPLQSTIVTKPQNSNTFSCYAYVKDGACPATPEYVEVNVTFGTKPKLTVEHAQVTCESPYKLQASASGGQVIWKDATHKELLGNNVELAAGVENIFYVNAKDERCTPAATTADEKVTVTLSGKPQLTLQNIYCLKDTLWVINEAEDLTNVVYSWNINGEVKSAYTENYYVFDAAGDYAVSVVGTATGGCQSDAATAQIHITEPIKLDWTTRPVAEIVYGSNLNGCVNVVSGKADDVATWTWLSPTDPTITGKCFNFSASAQEYNFQVYATDKYGCVSDTARSRTTVTGFGTLVMTVQSESGNEICRGGSALLRAEVTGGKAPYTYEWYIKGNTVPVKTVKTSSIVDILAVKPQANITYVVKVRDTETPPAYANGEVALTIKETSVVPVADAGPDMTIRRGVQTVLKAGSTGVKSWSWLPVDKFAAKVESGKQYPLTASLSGSQKYELYVTGMDGCISLPDTMVVFVLPFDGTETDIPTPPASDGLYLAVTPSVDTLCLGTKKWISVKDMVGNLSGSETYSWTPESGLTYNTKKDSALFAPTSAGDYSFIITVTDGAKRMALRSNIHVKDAYAPEFALQASGNCQHDTIKMVYNEGSVKATKHDWRVKGTSVNNPADYYILANAGDYKVEVIAENNGCKSTLKSLEVKVDVAPEIKQLVMSDSCGQAVVDVVATGVTAGYTWTSVPEGIVDANIPTRYIISTTGAYEVTVKASNAKCSAQRKLSGETYERPRLENWTIEPMDVNKNAAITAVAMVQNGSGTPGYSYHWLQPEITLNTGDYTVESATLASYTFEVYASDAKGCHSDTLLKTVNVSGGDVTVAIRSVYGDDVCKGGAAMLVAKAQGAVYPCTFEWTKSGSAGYKRRATVNSSLDTLWVMAEDVATYNVVLQDKNNAILATGSISSLTVNNDKAAPVVTAETRLTIQSGGQTVLPASVTSGTPAYKWHWSPASRLATLADTALQYAQTAVLTTGQTYQVYVTDAVSCVSKPVSTIVDVDNTNGICVKIEPEQKEICRANTLPMAAVVSCGKPSGWDLVYEWSPADGGLLNTTTNDSVIFTPQQEGEYVWIVKVSNGVFSAVAKANVTVKALDAPILAIDGRWDCVNDTLKLNVSGEVATNYVWTVDGVAASENGKEFVLKNKDIRQVEVYAEAANGCRSDVMVKNMKLGITPEVKILDGSFVCYPDSINTIKVKKTDGLTTENYTFAWTSNPEGKINGLKDQLSIQIQPASEDVVYSFIAVNKENTVCRASDQVNMYMIPKESMVEISKDEISGNIVLGWDKTKLGLADSVRIMNVKWDGYGVNSSYKQLTMLKGDAEKYMVDVSKDTLAFFYINASRHIEELGKSFYSLASDTVGYMKQTLYKNANLASGNEFNFIAYPFDMTEQGIAKKSDLAKNIGHNGDMNYAVFTLSHFDGSKWNPLTVLPGNGFDFSGSNIDLVVGGVYRVVLRKNENVNLLLYGKLPSKFTYRLESNNQFNFALTPLSFGARSLNRIDLGQTVDGVNTIGTYNYKEQVWKVSTRIPGKGGELDDWTGKLGDYNINLLRPVRIILMKTTEPYNWKK